MMHKARWFVFGSPLTAALTLFACGDDATPPFVTAEDGGSDAPASPPEAAPVPDAAVVDARVLVDASDEPITCTAKPCVIQLASGGDHFCALLEDKTVRCWGEAQAALGALAGSASDGLVQPRPIDLGLSGATQLSAGGYATCARMIDGTLKCWGINFANELGLEPPRADFTPYTPTTVVLDGGALDGFARVDVGKSGVAFAVKSSGELWSWGDNVKYALGRPRELGAFGEAWLGPGPVSYLAGESVLSAGGISFWSVAGSVAFAITSDRRLLTWGTSKQSVAYPGPVPTAIDGLDNVGSAGATEQNICAVANGRLYCWGQSGMLACTNSSEPVLSPVAIKTTREKMAQQVALGVNNTCVRLIDGTIECCGSDGRGQLGRANAGDGAALPESAPVLTLASAFTGYAVSVAVGTSAVCALVQGGTVQCWGGNELGQLGRGTVDEERHPTPETVQFD